MLGVCCNASSTLTLRPFGFAPPVAAVGGDDQLRLRVVDAVGERLGGEAAEDDGVRCADAGAGEHGDGELRNHRHVDGDAVAAPHAELLQRIGGPVHLDIEIVVGDDLAVSGLALPVVGDLVAAAGIDVAIEAVHGDIELTAVEPLGKGGIPLEDGVPGAIPIELCRLAGPIGLWVSRGPLVDRGVVDVRLSREFGRRREPSLLEKQRLDGHLTCPRSRSRTPGTRRSSLISLPRIVGGNRSRCRASLLTAIDPDDASIPAPFRGLSRVMGYRVFASPTA